MPKSYIFFKDVDLEEDDVDVVDVDVKIEGEEVHVKSEREQWSKEFTAYESTEFDLSQKSQLEMYLDEPRSDIDEDLDVLSFWKAHQYCYPELASMARDILSISVSTVESKSAFSNGGRVLNQYRSSLKHVIVEAIM
ncbi:unnamed protein product [Lactuca virosa]|uniref:HAT C-terminal dimerisation domain-containing protein n=1 Tax=Lactuca virosa TaxID=75947 RepID=A0AAU9MK90_9ASTR|nr:unnamed protein product [Lactuca virosa]